MSITKVPPYLPNCMDSQSADWHIRYLTVVDRYGVGRNGYLHVTCEAATARVLPMY